MIILLTVTVALGFGHPLLNHTRFESDSSSHMIKSTWNESIPAANSTDALHSRPIVTGCFLPTCLTVNLGSSLQTGDEKAGKSTSDPLGNGKK
ncbi:hypothetical protein WMY93_022040 [Mugilogobius chulae]|uniref:Secreted protein n=1 Tax=Mugilogobius chulae TaxID=88201 RepID=A0AAW0NDV3_9GOBI